MNSNSIHMRIDQRLLQEKIQDVVGCGPSPIDTSDDIRLQKHHAINCKSWLRGQAGKQVKHKEDDEELESWQSLPARKG